MHRRDLLRLFAAAAGALPFVPESAGEATEIGQRLHHRGRFAAPDGILDGAQARLVSALADVILPRTHMPGANDVDVTGFIGHLLGEWYEWDDAQTFLAGLAALDDRARLRHGASLVALGEERRIDLLGDVDREEGPPGTPAASWARLKSLVMYGYLTSERVMKEVAAYPLVPGRFVGSSSL